MMHATFAAVSLLVIAFLFQAGGVLDFPPAVWALFGLVVASAVVLDVVRKRAWA